MTPTRSRPFNAARGTTVERITALLPRTYRIGDAALGGPEQQLIELLATEIDVLEELVDQLYDNLFVETAAPWALPYLGDLIGYRPLAGPPDITAPRAEVANTIAYRRRKGTAAMLEQLTADVIGRPARAVEFFELLATTQYMNHPRPGKGATADVRDPLRLEGVGGAFDDLAHTADVRRIVTGAGRYNIHNVGVFVWRLDALSAGRAPLVPDGASRRRFRFHPLGIDAPLFGRARSEDEISHIAERFDVPIPLTRRWLSAQLSRYYGQGASLELGTDAAPVITTVTVCDLSDVPGDWAHAPTPGSGIVAIDPVLGRVYFADDIPAGQTPPPTATFHYGDALGIGGGGYGREPSVAASGPVLQVSGGADLQPPIGQVRGGGAVQITDSWHYPHNITVATDPGREVVLRAATGYRPLLSVDNQVTVTPGANGAVTLDGLLIAGGPVVLAAGADKKIRTLRLCNCTLVPGLTRGAGNVPATPATPSLVVTDPFARIEIRRCVLGPIVAVPGVDVTVVDSVLDASGATGSAYYGNLGDPEAPGATLSLHECTVIGAVHAAQIEEISNSIILGAVTVSRRQHGCVRFSYLPDGSHTPQTYRCQPSGTPVHPEFTSLRFGDPGYCQLRAGTIDAVRRGADNDSEMGVGNRLFGPVRESNLRARLGEYLRFGLEAGVFYAT